MSKARYTYRLRPGSVAEKALIQEGHRSRWLWNECVHRFRSQKGTQDLYTLLTKARADMFWMREGSVTPQQQTIRDYKRALNDSFKVRGRGRPKFKGKRNYLPSLNYTSNGFRFVDPEGSGRMPVLSLAGGIQIPIVYSRELPAYPSSVRVYQDSLGHWYASFVVDIEDETLPPTDSEGVGIDWGVKNPISTTDPECDEPYRGYAKNAHKGLAHYQRQCARRQPKKGQRGSRRYRQSLAMTRKAHKKVARQRKDNSVKWARRVVERHDLVAIEDLKLAFILRNRSFARKASDIGLAQYRTELESRAKRAGRRVVTVSPSYTTMTCAQCLVRAKQRLGLGERTFRCANPECGYTNDRDTNAAWMILRIAQGYTVGLYREDDEGVIPE